MPALVLRIAIAALCTGIAADALRAPDAIDAFVFMELDWSEPAATRLRISAAWALLALALALVARAWRLPALLTGVWALLLALVEQHVGGPAAALAPGGHAARWGGALALVLLCSGRENAALGLLRLSIAATFACHGLEALAARGDFQDLIFAAGERFGLSIPAGVAHGLLLAIGVQDLVLALAIVATRSRAVAAYMAVWGLVTAASRLVHSGLDVWPQLAVRLPHAGVPLALWLWWRAGVPRAGR